MQTILNWLSNFVSWLIALCIAFVNTFIDMLEDMVCWCVDEFLHVVIYLLGLLNLSAIFPSGFMTTLFNALPAVVINILWLLQVPYCISLILAATGVKLILKLIPFVRL